MVNKRSLRATRPLVTARARFTPLGMTFNERGHVNSAQEIYVYWLLQNPTITGSGCKLTPQRSNTFFWIASFGARISFALASPRFTIAKECLREIPTGPSE